MDGRALSPSPIALFLLGLAERGADGSVEVGGRVVSLRKGQVVDVRPAEGDGDLGAFLRDSGRVDAGILERSSAQAREEGVALGRVLVEQRLLSPETLKDVQRRLWLDRLVRGMARASAEGQEPAPLQADLRGPTDASTASLFTLVLDALERRAADGDAGEVGARADHRLEWLESPHLARARRWARFDGREDHPRIASLLSSEPAAAPRVAALVRAGLARIVSPDAPPAPAPRATASIPATARPARTPPFGIPAEARASLPPRKKPSVQLEPGLAPVFRDSPKLDVDLPVMPQRVAALDDPLDALERAIAGLEQRSSPGPERADAWRRFGDAWLERFGSIEEAARAFREAAAAAPGDTDALERASDLCAAIGQADLAVAYARASVSNLEEGAPRARGLLRYALLCRRLGKLSEALGAARAAATADPTGADASALTVHLWLELGRSADAAEAALEAATRLRSSDPARALSLVWLAQGLDPSSSEIAETLAQELADNGLVEASIAVRADAVRRTPTLDQRRALLLAAAEQAEVSDRPTLAAALLMRAFDAEPHLEVLYDPLDADLAQSGATLERAILLEEMAAAASDDTRAQCLKRAAEARLELPGDGAWEAELRARALELEPEDEANLQAIREQASARDDERLLADALERALSRGRWSGTTPQARMLEELARIAEDALEAPARAAWAWERLAAIDPDAPAPPRQLERLRPALAAHAARLVQLEAELKSAKGELRIDASRRLADHLRDDPEQRRRAIGLYREVLDAEPDSTRVADALERLARLIGDEYTEARTLATRAENANTKADRLRTMTKLAALQVLRRDLREAAIACRRILEEVPGHREASIRLRRAASRLRDRELLRVALASEAQMALPAMERARILTALALELEIAGSVEEAISCAEEALTADPSSAEAALLVARHLGSVEQPRAALGVVRALFGDSPPILEAWARVARDAGERDVMMEALDAWAHVAPFDCEPWALRLEAFPTSASDADLESTIEGALAPEHLSPNLAKPVARAIERLGERNPERAGRLAIRAADALGAHGDALRELAGRLADATGSKELRRAALERRAASAVEDTRVELLHDLAALHRESEDRAAEARTHLRILGAVPHDRRALSRLSEIYAETGEVDRLTAALTLELEAAKDDAARAEPLLRLASATALLRGDLDRAEALLRDAWNDEMESIEPLFTAAGALVTLGRARRAVEILREAARKLEPKRATQVFLRAVQIAIKKVGDPRLALAAAVEGMDQALGSGPLLLAFEQLALELKDIDAAERTYRRLIDRAMGPHGRRAVSYRRARWLERAGAARAALAAYLEAFEQSPQGGVVYTAIERLAREQGDLEAVVRAALALGERASHPAIRASMTREAAILLETELASPERAFATLADLWEHGGDNEVENDLVRLAATVRERDAAQGEAAFERLLGVLSRRADDAWMAEAKARLLLRQARLHAVGRDDLQTAIPLVDQALEVVRDEGGDADLMAELSLELATWLWEAGFREEATDRVRDAIDAKPNHAAARALATQMGLVLEPAPDSDAVGSDDPTADWGDLHAADEGIEDATGGVALIAEAITEAEAESNAAAEAKARAERAQAHADAERATREAEAKAREQAEAKAREQAEAKAREEAEAKARAEAEAKAREEAEAKAREEAEAKAREEAEAKAREEAEARARAEAEAKAREQAEAEARAEAEAKARREAEARARAEAEAKAHEEAAAAARRYAVAEARREAEAKARREAEAKAREEAEAEALREAEASAREAAIAEARREAEARARRDGEAKAREQAEAKAREQAEAEAREEEDRAGEREAEDQASPAPRAPRNRPSLARWSAVAPPEPTAVVEEAEPLEASAAEPASPPEDLPWVSAPPRDPEGAEAMERAGLRMLEDGSHGAMEQAVSLLRSALTMEPWRLSLLGPLAKAADASGAPRTATLARSLRGLFDDATGSPPALSPPPPHRILTLLREPTWNGTRELWRRVWEQALMLFRETPRQKPLPNDRVTRVATSPESRAFADALDALGREDMPAFYFQRGGEPTLEIVRTSPPTLMAGAGFAPDETAMRFRLGQALERSAPEHILVATLPEERARIVIAAVNAAFGPADTNKDVPREAAAFVSELWRIPTRSQGELRELLVSTDRWDDYEGTRRAVEDSGLRAGLVCCGDLGTAVREAALDEGFEAPESEEAVTRVLRESPPLSALVRFAFAKLSG